jgi:hypothetical protein
VGHQVTSCDAQNYVFELVIILHCTVHEQLDGCVDLSQHYPGSAIDNYRFFSVLVGPSKVHQRPTAIHGNTPFATAIGSWSGEIARANSRITLLTTGADMVFRCLLFATIFFVVSVGHNVEADELPPVFDGKSLDNWVLQNGKPIPSGWEVLDGTIHRKPSKKRVGHIVTQHEYGDFDLSFEWKIAKGGNSGLKYRVRKYGRKMLGCEYQIHDHGKPVDVPGNKHTGALYDLFGPDPKRKINPSGEFNASRIVVRGDHIEHWLNGRLIVSATVGSPEWEKRVASSKFNDVPDFARNRLGRIMLTDHGAEVWYRNFKITVPKAVGSKNSTDRDFGRVVPVGSKNSADR